MHSEISGNVIPRGARARRGAIEVRWFVLTPIAGPGPGRRTRVESREGWWIL